MTSTAGVSVVVLTSVEALAAVAEEWQQCYDAVEACPPFASPDWCLSWLRHYSSEDAVRAAVVRRTGQVVAVLPFHLARAHGVRVLSVAGGALSDYQDVAARLEPHEWRAVAAHLQRLRGWDVLDLRQVTNGAVLHGLAQQWDGPCRTYADAPTLQLPLAGAGNAEELAARVSRGLAKRVRQARRRAEQDGVVTRLRAPEAADVHRALELHRAAWRHRGMNPEHDRQRFLDHLVQALTALGRRGETLCYDVVQDGEVLVSRLILRRGPWVGCYLNGQHTTRSTARLDLPLLNMISLLDVAVPHGVQVVDQLRGVYPHKLRWRPQVVPTRRLLLLRTYRGWPYVTAVAGRHWVRQRAADDPRVHALLGRLRGADRGRAPVI